MGGGGGYPEGVWGRTRRGERLQNLKRVERLVWLVVRAPCHARRQRGTGDRVSGARTGLDLYFVARLLRSWLHNVLADGKEGGDGRVTHLWVNRPPQHHSGVDVGGKEGETFGRTP